MRTCIIESPFGADPEFFARYLEECIRHATYIRQRSPYASHKMLTGILDDAVPQERARGMVAGFAWHGLASEVAVYTDFGISEGMEEGIAHARSMGTNIVYCTLDLDEIEDPVVRRAIARRDQDGEATKMDKG